MTTECIGELTENRNKTKQKIDVEHSSVSVVMSKPFDSIRFEQTAAFILNNQMPSKRSDWIRYVVILEHTEHVSKICCVDR
jgi:hypothetical protein